MANENRDDHTLHSRRNDTYLLTRRLEVSIYSLNVRIIVIIIYY